MRDRSTFVRGTRVFEIRIELTVTGVLWSFANCFIFNYIFLLIVCVDVWTDSIVTFGLRFGTGEF